MKRTTKENYSRGSNGNPASTYVVESEQKDLVLRHLKNDCDIYRKNEEQLARLNDQYVVLQHRYKALADQINAEEKQFKMKHDSALRTISQLKNQIDSLQMELKDKKNQIGDLQSDANCLKNVFEERTIELEACRNDYKDAKADQNELLREKDNLMDGSDKIRQLVGEVKKEASLLQSDTDAVQKRYNELQRYHNQLIQQQKVVKQKIISFENENNAIDSDLNDVCGRLGNLQNAIKDAHAQLNALYDQTNNIDALNERNKNDLLMLQKTIQNQASKNNGLSKACKSAENSLKVRIGQVEQGIQQAKALKEEVNGLENVNSKLEQDLLACKAHLQNLGLINGKLIQHMETFNEEDSHVRALINRQGKIQYARSRVSEVVDTNRMLSQSRKNYQDSKASRRTFR